jgi:hypothetical protein
MNTNGGTVAVWVNTDGTDFPVPMTYFEPVINHGPSHISIQSFIPSTRESFTGTFGDSAGSVFTAPATPQHRLRAGMLRTLGIASFLLGLTAQ